MESKLIKSIAIVFECPFIDLADPTYEEQGMKLIRDVNRSYIDSISILSQSIQLLDRGVRNAYLLYLMAARVDVNSIDPDLAADQWQNMVYDITNAITDYLDSRDTEYEVIGESNESKELRRKRKEQINDFRLQ